MDAEKILDDAREWIVEDLVDVQAGFQATSSRRDDECEQTEVDFRVFLRPDGSVELCTGDASYDTDHRGYCGAGSVHVHDGEADIAAGVDDAFGQILDAIAAA
jgi:hypothetical protein